MHRRGRSQLILSCPVSNALKIPAFVMRTEVCTHALWGCRVRHDHIWCCVAVAHERKTKGLDAVVDVHTRTYRVGT
jgi:hypothetical protein